MEEVISGIYSITNKLTGQMYIGQSNNIYRRFQEHIKYKRDLHIDKSIRKYGPRFFIFTILYECPVEELNIEEEKFVALYNTYKDKKHFNHTPGGDKPFNYRSIKYRVHKAGIKNNKQQYTLVAPYGRVIKYSCNLEKLETWADKLNAGEITEKQLTEKKVKEKPPYKITSMGDRGYVIVDSFNNWIISSNDKNKIDTIFEGLLNKTISENELHIKKFRVVRKGYLGNKQKYALMSPNNQLIKMSIHKDILDSFSNDLNQGKVSVEEVKNKKWRNRKSIERMLE